MKKEWGTEKTCAGWCQGHPATAIIERLCNNDPSNPIYTIQPVVKPVVQPVWQRAVSCKQTSNRLSNWFDNRFDNRVERTAVVSTGCQTRLYNRFDKHGLTTVLKHGLTTVLNEQWLFIQLVVKPGCTTGLTTGCIHNIAVCQTGCQTGLTTGWMFVYTIQPVVKPVWQPVVSCKLGFSIYAERSLL